MSVSPSSERKRSLISATLRSTLRSDVVEESARNRDHAGPILRLILQHLMEHGTCLSTFYFFSRC